MGPARERLRQHEVEVAVFQPLKEVRAQSKVDLDLHLRVRAMKRLQRPRQTAQGVIFRHAQADGDGGLAASEVPAGIVGRAQDRPRVTQHDLPIGRQRHRVGGAREQGTPDFFLHPAHLLRDGGLGEMDAPRTPREAACFGHSDEGTEEVGVEHDAVNSLERSASILGPPRRKTRGGRTFPPGTWYRFPSGPLPDSKIQ